MKWTAQAVRDRAVEAAETLMLTPNSGGAGTTWSLAIDLAKESYGYNSAWYRRRPSPGALTRMAETWEWINRLPKESDRRLLYAWAWTKAKKGRSLNDFAESSGFIPRTLHRVVTRICQAIADDLNQRGIAWLEAPVDVVSENDGKTAPLRVSSRKSAPLDTGRYGFEEYASMVPGAKPRHDRSPEAKKRFAKELKLHNKAMRKHQSDESARRRQAKTRDGRGT